jgi:para-nitrobenzyl esterase
VFDIADREWLAGDRTDRTEVAHLVSSYFTNFARTGDPNGRGLAPWPPYSVASPRVQNLGRELVGDGPAQPG